MTPTSAAAAILLFVAVLAAFAAGVLVEHSQYMAFFLVAAGAAGTVGWGLHGMEEYYKGFDDGREEGRGE